MFSIRLIHRWYSQFFGAAILLAVLWGTGCKSGEEFLEPEKISVLLSEQEAKEAAELLKDAVEQCKENDLRRLINFSAIIRKGIFATTISNRSKNYFLNIFMKEGNQLHSTVCVDSAEVSILRVRSSQETGARTAVLKYKITEEFSMYLEFLFGRNETGTIVVSDVYIFNNDTLLSERVTDEVTVRAADVRKQTTYSSLIRKMGSDAVAGLREFSAASPIFRKSKVLWSFAILASLEVSKEEYRRVRNEYAEIFSDRSILDFTNLLGMYALEEWEEALESIERIDKRIGGDPALEVSRVAALGGLKRFAEAEERAKQYLRQYPAEYEMTVALLNLYLGNKQYGVALEVMKDIGDTFEVVFNESLVAQDDYPEFAKSEEWQLYNAWKTENFVVEGVLEEKPVAE